MKLKVQKILVWLMIVMINCGMVSVTNNYFMTYMVQAHPGRTDGSGGHRDNKNRSGLGYYHYHCGGYPAHLHKNGVCPYTSSKSSNTSSYRSSESSKKVSYSSNSSYAQMDSSLVKKVQKALNKRGYSCGTPDGKMGNKTRNALKKFQKDNGLTVDGKIGTQVKKALNIK